jgi:hypothetical protein
VGCPDKVPAADRIRELPAASGLATQDVALAPTPGPACPDPDRPARTVRPVREPPIGWPTLVACTSAVIQDKVTSRTVAAVVTVALQIAAGVASTAADSAAEAADSEEEVVDSVAEEAADVAVVEDAAGNVEEGNGARLGRRIPSGRPAAIAARWKIA